MSSVGLRRLVAAMAFSAAFMPSAGAAELSAQKSTQGGVTVSITPQNLASGAAAWDFKVVLDTHSQDLSDDLLKTSVLVDDTGKEHRAMGWKGAPAGGHHREGVLSFARVEPAPAIVELRMRRPGEPQARSFRWRLR